MRKKILGSLSLLLMVIVLAACGGNDESAAGGKVFGFGTQTYSDPKIMAQITKQLVEAETDHEINIQEDIQASPQIINAMEQDELQFAQLFTGEVYNNHFDEAEYSTDPEETMTQAQELFEEHYNFKWYDNAGFSNQYTIAVHADFAEENNITTMSDLAEHADDMILGADSTWVERDSDGYRGYQETYGYEFDDARGMQVALMYEGMANNELDAIVAHTVDPHIPENDLVILEDDGKFFPPYEGSIVVKNETIEEYPEVAEVLDSIVGLVSTEEMTELIRQVDIEGRTTEEVANEFLVEKGMLE